MAAIDFTTVEVWTKSGLPREVRSIVSQLPEQRGREACSFAARRPNLNAHLERFFGSLKSECLHKLILFGETSTRKAVRAFVTHYHTERNHQGLDNELIVPMVRPTVMVAEIESTERFGGLLRSHRRAA